MDKVILCNITSGGDSCQMGFWLYRPRLV